MKAITVRDSGGNLIAYGPAGGGYDPGVPVGATKTVESSYEDVYTEWQNTYVAPVVETPVDTKLAELESRLVALEGK